LVIKLTVSWNRSWVCDVKESKNASCTDDAKTGTAFHPPPHTHTHMAFVFLFTLFKSLESNQACRGFFYTDTLTKMIGDATVKNHYTASAITLSRITFHAFTVV